MISATRSGLVLIGVFLLLGRSGIPCSSDHMIWIPRHKAADALYRFIQDGKAGYIDREGKIIIQPELRTYGGNFGDEFHDGLLLTTDGCYVDATGRRAIDRKLERTWDFSEGLAAAISDLDGEWGYLDTNGDFAILPQFPSYPRGRISSFSEGLAAVTIGEKTGYIDKSGAFVIATTFAHAEGFHDGLARVVSKGPCSFWTGYWDPCLRTITVGTVNDEREYLELGACEVSYIDRSGRPICEATYQRARDFSEGLAAVAVGEKWGYIDRTGRLVVEAGFDEAFSFSEGLARVSQNRLYGYVDRTGAQVIPAKFVYAEEFSDGRAVVGNGKGAYWYINSAGEQAFEGRFYLASAFFKGLAHVRYRGSYAGNPRNGRYAYVDTEGRVVFTYTR